MKKNEKKKEYTLLTTDIYQFEYSEYVEFCEINGCEPKGEDSEAYWNWCDEERNINWECDRANLANSPLADRAFLITGTCGLWWGRPSIKPTFVRGLLDAIDKCYKGCDNVEVKLNTETGTLNVTSSHHDGTNCFEIMLLNKNGEKWADRLDDLGEDIEFNNRWWHKITDIGEIW